MVVNNFAVNVLLLIIRNIYSMWSQDEQRSKKLPLAYKNKSLGCRRCDHQFIRLWIMDGRARLLQQLVSRCAALA